MKRFAFANMAGVIVLSACSAAINDANTADDGSIAELPEQVVALAAPFQDLTTVRIDPANGCYLYQHVGPVETTFLPLLTTDGRPICTRAPEPGA